MITNLDLDTDCGCGNAKYITEIECINSVILPSAYVKFILQHNGASILNEDFEFYNPCLSKRETVFIDFLKVDKIQGYIDAKLFESQDEDEIGYFPEKLIPFGDSVEQVFICFDYRNCNTDDPPVVVWDGSECDNNVFFVAKNFEEFVGMLHEPKNISDNARECRKQTQTENKLKEEKMRTEYIANRNKRFEQLKNPQPLTAEEKQSAKIDEELQKDLEYADRQ